MQTIIRRLLIYVPIALAIVALGISGVLLISTDKTVITGMIEVTEIDLATKIPGRVDSILVREGDQVREGQLLAFLESKEIDAKVEQARGAKDAALAKLDMARNGARDEEKVAIEKLYLQARHQFELAEKTYDRVVALYADSVISTQERDEVEFKYKAAREQMEAAEAKYDMVMKGARSEEIRAVEGLFHQATNAFNEATAYQQELRIFCPIDGEVSQRIVDPGEMIAAGYPVFSVLDLSDVWAVIQVREDQMSEVRKGMRVSAVIPAVGSQAQVFTISYIAPMADFSTWRATSQKGEFDLKTFEIHLRPVTPVTGMRPGMTIRVEL